MHVFARGVAHEGLPHFLQNARFHQPAVEGVAKIVKTEVANPGAADGCLPGRLDLVDRTALVGKDETFRLPVGFEEGEEPSRDRYLAGFALRGFRMSDGEHMA